MSDLQTLANRVEAGSGPDPHLYRDICMSLKCRETDPDAIDFRAIEGDEPHFSYRIGDQVYNWMGGDPLTRSIDAVEALRKRLLPDSTVANISEDRGQFWQSTIFTTAGNEYVSEGYNIGEPRARLAALLRAIAGGA